MTTAKDQKPLTIRDIRSRKGGEKLVMVSAYDALFARIADEAGVDMLLVGDSLANIVAGLDSTLQVTLDQMIYHGASARRGCKRALLVVDMPFLTYQVSTEEALRNCGRVMQETGAQAVKLEGGTPHIADAVRAVVEMGVPVMGHLGFTPQSVHALGGPRVQAKDDAAAGRLLDDAKRLEDAGAFSIVLELVPAAVAERVTKAVSVPTIGIGAGPGCDGQVLVLPDLLGLNEGFNPKFLKRYAELGLAARDAVRAFAAETRAGAYPDDSHSF
ncbi:MAG TPA: 3-methyl-2-oxobutanoate hydroxymethyltransferase [Gemmatimonadaceae bacterium]|nr:3-methyl-2-oxobutanoate hydroxymethyltransferase [Gemmatimonadaceae bacterium]